MHTAAMVDMQAKRRSASDCRARFLMLMRARQAAAAPQKLHRPAALPLPAAARPSLPYTAAVAGSPAAYHVTSGSSNPAAARPAAAVSAPAQPQPIPAASLQIATAFAAQPSHHPSPVPTSTATAPAATTTAVHAYAAHQPVAAAASHSTPTAGVPVSHGMSTAGAAAPHGMTTSGAGLVSFVPQLSQLVRPQVMQQGLLGEHLLPPPQPAQQAQQTQQAQQGTAGWSSLAGSGLHPSTAQLANLPLSAAAVAAPARPGSTLSSLRPATPPVYPPAAVVTDIAAVAGSGRAIRLVHKASLDVLRLKLRLVDLVQGCPALQAKVSRCMHTRVSLHNLHHAPQSHLATPETCLQFCPDLMRCEPVYLPARFSKNQVVIAHDCVSASEYAKC